MHPFCPHPCARSRSRVATPPPPTGVGRVDTFHREASFSFKVIHLVDDAKTVSQSAQKVFCSGASDWGFQEFMPLSQVCPGPRRAARALAQRS